MNSRMRRSRALVAAIVAAVVASLFVLVPSASADILPNIVSVDSVITEHTPMWVLDFVFDLDAPLTPYCAAGQPAITIYFRVHTTTGQSDPCVRDPKYTNLGANQVLVHLDVLAANTFELTPSVPGGAIVSTVAVDAALSTSGPVGLDSHRIPRTGGPWTGHDQDAVAVPAAPTWIGMGDGYTSNVAGPDGGPFVDDNPSKWFERVVTKINGDRPDSANTNDVWAMTASSTALLAATSADVAAGQTTAMLNLLADHVVERSGGHYGNLSSWNWVSASAGLNDVGIPALMTNNYPFATSALPWAPTAAAACPDFDGPAGTTGVWQALNGAAGTSIAGNLLSAFHAARAASADPNVHLAQVAYPELTDEANVCAGANTTTVDNRTVMNKLRSVSDLTTTEPSLDVHVIDLKAKYGPNPVAAPSRLLLARGGGYPFPSPSGVGQIAVSALAVLKSAAVDATAPEVTVDYIDEPQTESLWWNTDTVTVHWKATDANGVLDTPPDGPWSVPGEPTTTVSDEGVHQLLPPYRACDPSHNCTFGDGVAIGIDRTGPVGTVIASRGADPRTGWYHKIPNDPLTVSWTATDEKLDASGQPIQVSGFNGILPGPVEVTQGGTTVVIDPPATIADKAGNVSTLPSITLNNVDLVDPVVTAHLTSTAEHVGNVYHGPVTVSWTATDVGSGMSPLPAAVVVGADQPETRTVSSHICDVAGNCVDSSVTVTVDPTAVLDHVAPVLTVPLLPVGVVAGTPLTLSAAGVSAVDAVDGPVTPDCGPLIFTASQLGPRTVTCTATDAAGNKATKSMGVVVGAQLGAGSFVIGDRSAGWMSHVVFWSSDWDEENRMSGSAHTSAFKGFAETVDRALGKWSTKTSSKPPATVPSYIAVIVTNGAVKTGATIGGNIVRSVIVRVDPGFVRNRDGKGYVLAKIP